jgi:hypothetical protein
LQLQNCGEKSAIWADVFGSGFSAMTAAANSIPINITVSGGVDVVAGPDKPNFGISAMPLS